MECHGITFAGGIGSTVAYWTDLAHVLQPRNGVVHSVFSDVRDPKRISAVPLIRAEALTDFVEALFTASGVPADEATVVTKNLVGANLRGHDSHGVLRVPQYLDFVKKGDYKLGVAPEGREGRPRRRRLRRPVGLRPGPGPPAARPDPAQGQALGLAAGTARNCGHIGRLGDYAERAAEQGLVLIATVNNNGAGHRVAPPGGKAGRLGTNPLCAAVPTDDEPVVLDFGTSVVAEGKVRTYYAAARSPSPKGGCSTPQGDRRPTPRSCTSRPSARSCRWAAPRPTRGSASAWSSTCSPAA